MRERMRLAISVGRVIVGTVKGDLHDVGENIVAAMLEGGGFEVTDLGADVSSDKFVAAVIEKKPDLVCFSVLLTVTMLSMKTSIEALQQAGVRRALKAMIGGAPFTQQYSDQVGADGYGENIAAAVTLARKLMESN